jgi:hypothetical protein
VAEAADIIKYTPASVHTTYRSEFGALSDLVNISLIEVQPPDSRHLSTIPYSLQLNVWIQKCL